LVGDVAALADIQQLRLAAGRLLMRNEAEPRGEVSLFTERCVVTDGCDDRGRNDGTDTWDLTDAAATCIACSNLFKPVS
jgi:hypothetical protein